MADTLSTLIAPPAHPTDALTDWSAVEARVGLILPNDYKSFVRSYGTGSIDEFFSVLCPSAANPYLNLENRGAVLLAALREVRASQPAAVASAIYPEAGGLFPWAVTDNGDVCYWDTRARDPNEWTVVLHDARVWTWDKFRGGMGKFLLELISGSYREEVFPRDFPARPSHFRPSYYRPN